MLEFYSKLINNKERADVHIKFNGSEEVLFAHRLILSYNSEVFDRMFFGQNWFEKSEQNIFILTINDIDVYTFKLFFNFVILNRFTLIANWQLICSMLLKSIESKN